MEKGTTLTRFIIEHHRDRPDLEFTELLTELTLAGKMIAREVNKAGLAVTMGLTGRTNVHGEAVQKLDEFANATILKTTDHTGHLAGIASDEMEDILHIPDIHPSGDNILVFDLVYDSSNIDIYISI